MESFRFIGASIIQGPLDIIVIFIPYHYGLHDNEATTRVHERPMPYTTSTEKTKCSIKCTVVGQT